MKSDVVRELEIVQTSFKQWSATEPKMNVNCHNSVPIAVNFKRFRNSGAVTPRETEGRLKVRDSSHFLHKKPCRLPSSMYSPTMSPAELIEKSAVSTRPTSMVVMLPSGLRRKPWEPFSFE
jgi:hypothetical protein